MFLFKPYDYLRRKIGDHGLPTKESTKASQGSHHKSASLPAMSGYPAGHDPYTASQWNFAHRYTPPWQAQQYPHPFPYPNAYPFPQGPPPGPLPHSHANHTPSVPRTEPPVPYQSQTYVAAPTPIRPSRSRSQSRHARDTESHASSASRLGAPHPTLNISNERLDRGRDFDREVRVNRPLRREPTPAPSRSQRAATSRSDPLAPAADNVPHHEATNKAHGLLRELSSTPPYPTIEWNITHRLHHAVMIVRPGKTERLDMDRKAVVPGPPFLYVTTLNMSSPLQTVLNRWGPIIIKTKKYAVGDGERPGYTLGDILQGLHRYFNTCLSKEEIKDLTPEENMSMRASGSRRWRAAHDVDHLGWNSEDEDDLLEDVSKGYNRADFLEGHLYFGGLTILSNFHETKTLYLILETSSRRQK